MVLPREAFFEYLPYQINGFGYETLSKPIRKIRKIREIRKTRKTPGSFSPSLPPPFSLHTFRSLTALAAGDLGLPVDSGWRYMN